MKNLKTLLLSLLLLSAGAHGSLLVGSTEDAGTNSLPDASTHFSSDTIVCPDTIPGIQMGSVPVEFTDWQVIRPVCLFVNLDTNMRWSTSGGTEPGSTTDVYYAHVVPDGVDQTTHKPSWLTGPDWADSGLTGWVLMPDALGEPGADFNQEPVYYYKKNDHTGDYNYAGYRSSDYEKALGHYVGWFLFEPGTTIDDSLTAPRIYRRIASISDPYTALPEDEFLWETDANLGTYPSPDFTASNWQDIDNQVALASCGDHVAVTDATYTNAGTVTISNVNCTLANPIHLHPETEGGVIMSGATSLYWDNSDGIVVDGFSVTGTQSADDFYKIFYIQDGSEENVVRNVDFHDIEGAQSVCPGRNSGNTSCRSFLIYIKGDGNVAYQNDFDDHDDSLQSIYVGNAGTVIYNIIRHNDFFNRIVTGEDSDPGEDVQLGNTPQDKATIHNTLLIYNRFYQWDNPEESEWIGTKSDGNIIAYNEFRDGIGNIGVRSGADYFVYANRQYNTARQNTANQLFNLQGSSEYRTDAVIALNWIDYFSGGDGYFKVQGVGADQDPREKYKGTRALVVQNMVVDSDATIWLNDDVGTAPHDEFTELRFECNAVKTSGTMFNDSEFLMQDQSTWTLSANVMYTTGTFGWSPAPATSAVLNADPAFSARYVGSSMNTPTHASLDCGDNLARMGWLPDGSIENVGATH